MSTQQSIGDWIKAEREQRELTQRGLAELADIHWTSLSAVERGEREPTADLIIKLAQAFDSTAEELVVRLAQAGIWKKTIINGVGDSDSWWVSRCKRFARGATRAAIEQAVMLFETGIKMNS